MTATERETWLAERRRGIGSSDTAKILGVSKHGTALSVYLDKIGAAPEEPRSDRLLNGTRFEPAIAGAIIDEYGWTLKKVGMEQHADLPFILSNRDRISIDPSDSLEVTTEIKTFEVYQQSDLGEPETDEIPLEHACQVQHQLEVARSIGYYHEHAWYFAQVGFSEKVRRYRVHFDPEFFPTVLPALQEFWHRVETRTPPEPDWSHPTTLENLQSLYEPVIGKSVALDADMVQYATEYVQLGAEASAANSRRDEAKARLIAAMGDAELAALPDGRMITRRKVERKGFTVEPTSYFNFSIKEPKHGK